MAEVAARSSCPRTDRTPERILAYRARGVRLADSLAGHSTSAEVREDLSVQMSCK
jgi:hypothetical protein